jgi:hypothetical protein
MSKSGNFAEGNRRSGGGGNKRSPHIVSKVKSQNFPSGGDFIESSFTLVGKAWRR